MEHQQHTRTISWLQRLKDESWEAELLVAAVAIYAILNSFSALDWAVIQFIDYLNPSQYLIGYVIMVCGYMAVGILAAMFAIHFTLRAYWIGLVGLNSVFPDYGLEDSAYSPIYTKKILGILPKVTKSISKIDELCSVIFSSAFALMMVYLYISITISIYLMLYNLLIDVLPNWLLLAPVAILVLFMLFGMLIMVPANMKRFHSNERIQHLYFLYAKWGGVLTYGPLNKSIFQISMLFASNFKKKKGLVKMILFMLLIGAIFGGAKMLDSHFGYLLQHSREQDTTHVQSSFFANHNSHRDFLLGPEVNSDIITEPTIQLFIPIFRHEVKMLKSLCNIEESDKVGKKEISEQNRIRQAYLGCFQTHHNVFIDGKPVKVSFLKTHHPVTEQYGITCYIPLETYKKGPHELLIQKNLAKEDKKEWRIPLYYASK